MKKANVPRRSVVIAGNRTTISLEETFYDCLGEIAAQRGITITALIEEIDRSRSHPNLSSAIRLFVLEYYRRQAGAAAGVAG